MGGVIEKAVAHGTAVPALGSGEWLCEGSCRALLCIANRVIYIAGRQGGVGVASIAVLFCSGFLVDSRVSFTCP